MHLEFILPRGLENWEAHIHDGRKSSESYESRTATGAHTILSQLPKEKHSTNGWRNPPEG
jgi:hypothetical protein